MREKKWEKRKWEENDFYLFVCIKKWEEKINVNLTTILFNK